MIGIESSVGGINDDGVLSTEDDDGGYAYVTNIIPLFSFSLDKPFN